MSEAGSGSPDRKGKKKKRTAGTIAYRLLVVILLGIMVVSGYKVAKTYYAYYAARQEYKKVSEVVDIDLDKMTVDVDWNALQEINPEVCGWIFLNDSVINYPVAQGMDNDKYLHHLIDGTYHFAGTIFVDCHAAADFRGFNTVVYGHHMKDGSMFAPLQKFITDADYYESHRSFELFTPNGHYHLAVFAAFVTDAESDVYNMYFSDDEERRAHINRMISRSCIAADGMTVGPEDRIVTLSTCVDAEGDARYVVICKMVPWDGAE